MRKKTAYILFSIILLAFGLRLARCFLVDRFYKDGVIYIAMAQNFAGGDTKAGCALRPEMPPLFPYLMGIGERIGVSAEYSGKLMNLIFGVLAVFASFLVADLIFKKKIALLAAFLCAVNPVLVESSTGIMREETSLCFMLFSLFFILKSIKYEKYNFLNWIIAGILSAIAALIRPDGFEILVVLVVWLILSFIFCKTERMNIIRRVIPGFVVMLIFFASVVYPVQSYFNRYGSYYTVIPNSKTLKIYLRIN
jgi:asparagine N-glycosylation enzyme membrane subunit Stt3